ncbi:MAG: fluoride efflux transporter CrcB [Desulfobacterales bacterium]
MGCRPDEQAELEKERMRIGLSGLATKLLLVMVGGGAGALCRYGVSLAALRIFGTAFPWGTLIVNMMGCFMIGVLFALTDRWTALGPSVRILLMTGFLGALTTFSTFALETLASARSGNFLGAAANLAANNIGGLLLVLSGIGLVQLLFKGR